MEQQGEPSPISFSQPDTAARSMPANTKLQAPPGRSEVDGPRKNKITVQCYAHGQFLNRVFDGGVGSCPIKLVGWHIVVIPLG
jgi:hypothetical protein